MCVLLASTKNRLGARIFSESRLTLTREPRIFFRRRIQAGEIEGPAVFLGGSDHWPARRWSPAVIGGGTLGEVVTTVRFALRDRVGVTWEVGPGTFDPPPCRD